MVGIRLAFREEGEYYNAYIAVMDTMDGAILLGSIKMGAVRRNPEVEENFKTLMKLALSDTIKDVTGEDVTDYGERPAPQNEKAGHG